MDNANETQQMSKPKAEDAPVDLGAHPKAEDAPVDLGAALTNPRADAEELNQLEQNLFLTRYCSAEIAGFGMSIDPVSYTHLTLPTICSV